MICLYDVYCIFVVLLVVLLKKTTTDVCVIIIDTCKELLQTNLSRIPITGSVRRLGFTVLTPAERQIERTKSEDYALSVKIY